jgi:hypothetical protein
MKKYLPLLLVIILGGVFVFTLRVWSDYPFDPSIIATVGDEKIYQEDLEYELANHPQRLDPGTRDILIEQMIRDSIILQGGMRDGKVTLDSTVFNSKSKNFDMRSEKVQQVLQLVKNESNTATGTVITIWFLNNNHTGTLGYERGKSFAYSKIAPLHKAVSEGTMTPSEAAESIASDQTLSQIDVAYNTNAKIDFSILEGEKVTFDDNLNNIIWTLNSGDTSDIIALTEDSYVYGDNAEVAYAFVYMEERQMKENAITIDEWYDTYKAEFTVTKK